LGFRHLPAQENGMTTLFRAIPAGWAAFYAAVLLAWAALWVMVQDRAAFSGAWGLDLLAGLCRTGAGDAGVGGLYAMWAVMAVAMMAPTAVPAFRTWARLPAAASGGAAGTAALGAGYLAVWLGASGAFAAVQAALAGQGWLAPDGASLSPMLNAALCALAGGYQFSRLKDACLSKCRLPLTFFMERWRPGLGGALRSGLDLGLVCLGCCWALMALAFVGGMASLVWMGLATALMVVEKLPDIGRHVTRPLGWALLAAALAFASHGALA
jgi:predicted metal-binding membrane protein